MSSCSASTSIKALHTSACSVHLLLICTTFSSNPPAVPQQRGINGDEEVLAGSSCTELQGGGSGGRGIN